MGNNEGSKEGSPYASRLLLYSYEKLVTKAAGHRLETPVTPRRQAPADLSDKTIGDLDVSGDGLDGSAAAHPNKPGNPATTLLFPSSEIGSSPR